MNYKEWFQKTCARFMLSADEVDLLLVNQSGRIPDPDAEVDVALAQRALFEEVGTLLPMYDVSEGGYSLHWNWNALQMWYRMMAKKFNLDDVTKPKIRNRSNLW